MSLYHIIVGNLVQFTNAVHTYVCVVYTCTYGLNLYTVCMLVCMCMYFTVHVLHNACTGIVYINQIVYTCTFPFQCMCCTVAFDD